MEVLLNIHPRITTALKKAGLKDLAEILSLSGPDLSRLTRLSPADVQRTKDAAAESIPRPAIITALALLEPGCPEALACRALSTGCRVLDGLLRGGVLTRALTEVSGESASGKTQLCLQLCITAQLGADLAGLGAGALYICTEDAFPSQRLVQMADRLQRRCPLLSDIQFTNNIYVEHIADVDGLRHCLEIKCPALLSSRRIKLIVVDSIAALFRAEFSSSDLIGRAKQLSGLAGLLRCHANEYNIAVVVVNQVTDDFTPRVFRSPAEPRPKVPALGLAWANLVTVRLLLSRTSETIAMTTPLDAGRNPGELSQGPGGKNQGSGGQNSGPVGLGQGPGEQRCKSEGGRSYEAGVRAMEVVFAPHLPRAIARFVIDEDGVKGLGSNLKM